MIDSKRFSLNRIACPSLSMAEFLDLARGVGISKVELRNDIRDGRVLDGMDPKTVAKLMTEKGVRAITVNALQKFNLASARPKARADLASLLADCAGVGCPALVLCPNNESNDARSAGAKFAEAVDSLKEFGPMFEKAGVLGLVEPLGFGISSLASVAVAIEAVEKSGFPYKVLVDTFHHYLGPDDASTLKKAARAGLVGLVHVSGVEAAIPKTAFLDAHRIMPGPGDVMNSKAIIQTLLDAGYEGDISFEPFSGEVQAMSPKALSAALARSMEYLAR